MIFRNSILSIVRSKGKTALFTLLIFALTLALALGVSVWASVAQFLTDCDDYYTTIGLLEYMGTGYPDDTTYDTAMAKALTSFDTAAISEDEATLMWETPIRSLGYIEGFWRSDSFMPGQDLSVLVVGNVFYAENHKSYSATVVNALYSRKSRDNTILIIDGNFGTFERGHFYLVFGEVYYDRSLHLRTTSFDNATAAANGAEIPRMIDITSDGTDGSFYDIPEDSVLTQVANALTVTNNSVLVSGTDDLFSLLPFHQQELYIVDGRAFTKDEYTNGSHVAVISELMAARLNVGVGDTIELSVAVSDQPGIYNSYWVTEGFSYNGTYTVVGIMNTVLDKSWYIYVPKSTDVPASQFQVGYTVGQAVIRNEEAAAFYAQISAILEDRFQLTIYDQGYSSVTIPYQTILSVAKIVTAVCSLMELAVVILFGFLFVYRQRETSETMLMLGAGRTRVCGYFLFSSGLISLVAAAAGAVAGYWLHDGIIAFVANAADNYALIDSRYSNGNLTISRTLEFAPELNWKLFLIVGVVVFFLAVLACLGFAVATFINSRPSQRKASGPKKERNTSHLKGGSIKYAVLSILRGGTRSMVVPLLAATVVIFFGQLATTSLRYQNQLNTIYDNITIEGYYTDIHGKQIGGLLVSAYDVGNLYHTGQLSTLSISIGEPYYYLGISKLADGTDTNISPLYVPSSGFRCESLEAAILRGPDLTATNDIRKSPEFFYADTIRLTFLEGYDETFLTVPSEDKNVFSCIIPTSLMAEQGIELGDSVRVAIDKVRRDPESDEKTFYHYDLLVIGSYETQGVEETIYAPLSLFFNTELIWGAGQAVVGPPSETFNTGYRVNDEQIDELQSTVFNSTTFTTSDSRSLVAFKDYINDYGYSQVHHIDSVREFIVLKDASFNNAVASVKQQIRYINTLYPCLYTLVGIIAFAVSYLLVVSRKKEFATMRGLGATRLRSFFSFFLEQSMLCVLGTLIGLAAWQFFWDAPTSLHLILSAGFLACYFIGCAISIIIMNQTNVLTILLDRE